MPPRPQVLNDVFQQAADQARQKLPQLTQNQQVARLYRDSLKLLNSWAIDRDIFNEEATKLRAQFDESRGCNAGKALRLLRVSADYFFFIHDSEMVVRLILHLIRSFRREKINCMITRTQIHTATLSCLEVLSSCEILLCQWMYASLTETTLLTLQTMKSTLIGARLLQKTDEQLLDTS